MKNNCFFCQKKQDPSYKETRVLSDFLSERGKIIGRSKTELCQKHQKRLAKAIKQARHLAMLPFVAKP